MILVFSSDMRRLLSSGIGVSVTIAASAAIAFIETLVVSALGADQLAGVTVALSVYNLIFVGCMGMAVAITPIVSLAVGKKSDLAIRIAAHQGIWVVGAVSIAGLIVLALSLPLLGGLTNTPAQHASALNYLLWTALGLPAWVLYFGLRSILVAVKKVKVASYAMVASVPVHAALAYALTNGTMLTQPMGVGGAGLAFSLTSWITVAVILAAIRTSDAPVLENLARGPFWFRKEEFLPIVRLGLPTAARVLMKEGMLPASVLLVASLGTDNVVAHAIALRVIALSGIATFGISIATIAQVGEAMGGGKLLHARYLSWMAVRLCVTIGAALCLGIVAAAKPISELFIPSADVALVAFAARLLGIACVFILVNCLQAPIIGALVALQDAKVPLLIFAGGNWVIGFPLAYAMSRMVHYQLEGAWSGLIIGSLVATGLLAARLRANFTSMRIAVAG